MLQAAAANADPGNSDGTRGDFNENGEQKQVKVMLMDDRQPLDIPYKMNMTFADLVQEIAAAKNLSSPSAIMFISFIKEDYKPKLICTSDSHVMSKTLKLTTAYKIYFVSPDPFCETPVKHTNNEMNKTMQQQWSESKSPAYIWMQYLKILNAKMVASGRFWADLTAFPDLFLSGGSIYEFCKELSPNRTFINKLHFVLLAYPPVKCFAYNGAKDRLDICLGDLGHFPMNTDTRCHFEDFACEESDVGINYLMSGDETDRLAYWVPIEKVDVGLKFCENLKD